MVKEAKAAQQQKISDLEASLAKATTDLLANRAAVSVLKGEKAQLEKNLAAQVDLLANRAAVSVLKGEKAQLEKNLAAQVEAAEGFKKDIEKVFFSLLYLPPSSSLSPSCFSLARTPPPAQLAFAKEEEEEEDFFFFSRTLR
eukprot:TRINITY_DN110_c0_g1_i16.p2 TRINITY_DN110_c0_g1~~TRINITY_DN110_c0_g1_i16.p2  ORF type:complete len:142 (-),score=74.59 TRINITY_DN110_c0_g1_i16:36-461(-)